MNQSCLLGDLCPCQGLWDGAGGGGSPPRCVVSGHTVGCPLPPLFHPSRSPTPVPSQAAMCMPCTSLLHTFYLQMTWFFFTHIVRTLRLSLPPSCLQEARRTALPRVPSQREKGDDWQVAPKTPTEKKEYSGKVLRIRANAKPRRHKGTANLSLDFLTIKYTAIETVSPHLFSFCV